MASSSDQSEKPVILVAIDASEPSTNALKWTLHHFFNNNNSIFKLVLVHARISASSSLSLAGSAIADYLGAQAVDDAKKLCVEKSVNDVTEEVVDGDPKKVLCHTVDTYHASMLVVGSGGHGAIKRDSLAWSPLTSFVSSDRVLLGSVSEYCARHANCTVIIVKEPKPPGLKIMASSSDQSEKPAILVEIDATEQSMYALKWTLDHFFTNINSIFKLVLVHASSAADALASVDSDLSNIDVEAVYDAKKICVEKSVNDVIEEVVEGDPKNVLCDTVSKYHASILVMGNNGHGDVIRAYLGSVTGHCARHAKCTVIIVTEPKTKE